MNDRGSWEAAQLLRLDEHPNGFSSSGRRETPLTVLLALFIPLRVKEGPLLDAVALCADSASRRSCELACEVIICRVRRVQEVKKK